MIRLERGIPFVIFSNSDMRVFHWSASSEIFMFWRTESEFRLQALNYRVPSRKCYYMEVIHTALRGEGLYWIKYLHSLRNTILEYFIAVLVPLSFFPAPFSDLVCRRTSFSLPHSYSHLYSLYKVSRFWIRNHNFVEKYFKYLRTRFAKPEIIKIPNNISSFVQFAIGVVKKKIKKKLYG